MSQSLRQVWSIAGAEFRLHWRRRALVVITLSLLVLPAMAGLFLRNEFSAAGGSVASVIGLSAGDARDPVTIAAVYGTWGAVYVVLALLLPPVMAESLPRDQQLGVRELLDSLPLTTGAYLAGKLLGAWLALAAGLGAAMLAIGTLWLVLVGRFNPGPYLNMWLVGALGMAVINSALGVLLAGAQPNRRRAVLMGVALSVLVLFFLSRDLQAEPGSARYILSLARPALFSYYIFGWMDLPAAAFGPTATVRHVWLTLLAGAGQVAVLAAGLWAWLRWRGHRL
jgi:hypothetical protein